MLKMIIVDDNIRNINELCDIIDWNAFGIEICGTFFNGKEVMDNIDGLKPDIIITDIMMPIMNGIDMSKSIRIKYPNITIIFVSSHDDFEFAKCAVDLDIDGYLLKPIIRQDVIEIINKIVNSYQAEYLKNKEKEEMIKQIEASKPILKDQFYKELLYGVICEEQEIYRKFKFFDITVNDSDKIIVLSLNLYDSNAVSSMEMMERYLLQLSIKNDIEKLSKTEIESLVLQVSELEFVSIVLLSKDKSEQENDLMLDYSVAIYDLLNEKYNINSTIGISKTAISFLEIPILFQQSKEALKYKFYVNENPIIRYFEIEDIKPNVLEEKVDYGKLFNEIKDIIKCDDIFIKEFVDKYIHIGVVDGNDSEEFIKSLTFIIVSFLQIILTDYNQTFNDIFNEDIVIWKKISYINSLVNIKQWLFNIICVVKNHLSAKNSSSNAILVNRIKDVVHNHYQEEITVKDIAEAVYFSTRQANNIFLKETGLSIFDYMLQYRIEIAKKLLTTTQMRIYEVAEKVGYQNMSYFRLLFLNSTGVLPTEYKKMQYK